MYQQLILLHTPLADALAVAQKAIEDHYTALNEGETPTFAVKRGTMYIRFGEFKFLLDYNAAPYIVQESAEMAAEYGEGRDDRAAIAAVTARFELDSDDDPEMDRFNDMLYICEALESLGVVAIFDPQAGEFQ